MNLTFTPETVASWDGWYLDVQAQTLLYDMPYSEHPNFYEVRPAEIESVDDIEQRCFHVELKTWVTPECVQGLRKAFIQYLLFRYCSTSDVWRGAR